MKRWFPGWRLSTPSEEVVQDISVLVRFYPMVVSVDRVSARRESIACRQSGVQRVTTVDGVAPALFIIDARRRRPTVCGCVIPGLRQTCMGLDPQMPRAQRSRAAAEMLRCLLESGRSGAAVLALQRDAAQADEADTAETVAVQGVEALDRFEAGHAHLVRLI